MSGKNERDFNLTAEPTCSAARPQRKRGRTAEHGGEVEPLGTPPSNTVPYNCNSEFFKALRWGVDSLYPSYPGEIFPEVDAKLKDLKKIAQSPEDHEKILAQYPVDGHIFEVKDKGVKYFPYILDDNAFRIQLSPSKAMPLAYARISSEYLTHVGTVEAEKALRHIVEQFGDVSDFANVSRIDLFVDFVSSVDMESWDRHAWVTRASDIDTFSIDRVFSGWLIGKGGIISCRLYDKTLEIEKQSKKYYLHKLWQMAGWNGKDKVWRLEFELKREVLTRKGLSKLHEVLANLNGIWSYCTTEWLRLTLPNSDDQTRSRWPVHPLWGYLSSVDWETNGGALSSRFSASRVPGDDKLFSMGLSTLISFMAREGIKDYTAGSEAFVSAMQNYHEGKSHWIGLPFNDYIAEKVAIKGRLFNSILNGKEPTQIQKMAEANRQAEAYRKQSEGD